MLRTWQFRCPALLFVALAMILSSCKIPESMAPRIAKEATKAWRKVDYNDQRMMIWPDRSKAPDRVFTIRYRDRLLATPRNGFRYDLLEPTAHQGFAAGFEKRLFWIRLAGNRGRMILSGIPAYDEGRAMTILERVIRENLEVMDFSISRVEWKGSKVLRTITTPDPWSDKFFFQSITYADTDTRVIKMAQELDRKGTVGQVWEVVAYTRGQVQAQDTYCLPPKNDNEPDIRVDLTGTGPGTCRAYTGPAPWIHPTRPAVHSTQQSAFGPILVSDYGDGVNQLYLVHYPRKAPRFDVPWARQITIDGKDVRVALLDGFIFMSVETQTNRAVILAQDNLNPILHFAEELKPGRPDGSPNK